ncbi:RNA polymerase sigma factor [Streptomyces sp. BE20]|uniref:RNA polymerase sigma factor n=1 Tax=Streptomycetaceae TaxID=2062 RepID=UPI002E79EF0F|nr:MULTISPECIES: RNA polymerase sigma factor [unclassified Streptomyces]MED7954807.1 RNA polymerase sigma factor [Streptomyces sp. BE303]MEE1827392.1 RNA polymerase sigma factor [Streptomyces sp. BE20]
MELSQRGRLRSGDQWAFGELFDETAGDLYRYAVRVSGDWAVAEDVVQLTFLEAWRLRHRLHEGDESVRPWLFGVAANVLRNTARAARRHRAAMERLPERDVVPDFADELVGRLDDSAQLAAARRALVRLRKAERDVFGLCVWAGLDYASAAEALGVPIGTVRSRLSRARTKLRALAEEELGSGRELRAEVGQVRGGRVDAARSTRETNR